MAIQHASSALWAKVFPDSPWTAGPATFFGNEVWFRSKVYKGKREPTTVNMKGPAVKEA